MKRPVLGILLLCVTLAVAGCTKSDSTDPAAKGDPAATKDKDKGTAKADDSGPPAQLLSLNIAKKQSLEGRWILVFYERMSGLEVPAALVDISKSPKDGKLRAQVKSFGPMLSHPTLKETSVTNDTVHLVIDLTVQRMSPNEPASTDAKRLDILVELRDGLARGSAQFSPFEGFVVAMIPTDKETLQGMRPQQLPETVELSGDKNMTQQQVMEKTASFLHAHPDSPLTMEIYPFYFRSAAERKLDEKTLNAEADKYAAIASSWSSRLGLKARIDVAGGLVTAGYLPKVSLKQIDMTLAKLTEDTSPIWKGVLDDLKNAAVSNEALTNIESGTPAEKTKAAEFLRESLKQRAYNPVVTLALAQYEEQSDKKQQALHDYAQLAVLPLFEEVLKELHKATPEKKVPAKQAAQKLWKELHGGKLDGFDAYLDQIYTESMPKFKEKPVPPRAHADDNRVVLCELFTGTSCSVCVAADVAFSQLVKTYSPSEVVFLQYHEHVPQPDPLANTDTEQRFRYYFPERGGTPTFVISGIPANRGGMLHQVEEVYKGIRQMIDFMLAKKTSVRIHLKAEPKDGVVAISAAAEGSFGQTDPIHMRLALAEEHVAARGSNGIREHEMVVRAMPGGVAGVELKSGKLQYQGTVDLKTIKRQLDDYLRAFEEAQKTTFAQKPLDLTHLRLVAFVQNDRTKEVYQAAMIPFPSGPSAPAGKSQASTEKAQSATRAVTKATP